MTSDEVLAGSDDQQLDAEYFCTHDTTPKLFSGFLIDNRYGDRCFTWRLDDDWLGGSRRRAWTRVVMGIDVILFASRHLFVVCTQTCTFRCCIVFEAVVC